MLVPTCRDRSRCSLRQAQGTYFRRLSISASSIQRLSKPILVPFGKLRAGTFDQAGRDQGKSRKLTANSQQPKTAKPSTGLRASSRWLRADSYSTPSHNFDRLPLIPKSRIDDIVVNRSECIADPYRSPITLLCFQLFPP